jgi:hypothetical protein
VSLALIGQDDFGVGILRGVAPDVQPGVGLYNSLNGLYNDDGDVYRRGGTSYLSASTPAIPALTFIWTGYLGGVARTLLATSANFYTLDSTQHPVLLSPPGLPGPVQPVVVGDTMYLPNGYKWTGSGALTTWAAPASLPAGPRHLCAAAGRLLVATGNKIAFSPPDTPEAFVADDFHLLPGGVVVMGMAAIRDTAFVFTNYGVWTITNLAFDLTDAYGNIQQQLQLVAPEMSLWHESGLCEWETRIIAPCMDRCYAIDGLSTPQPISESIAPYYMSFIRSGFRPGGAKVFRNHLFLPILNSVNAVQTVLCCRLSRPVRGRLLYFPWTTLTGHAAKMVTGDVSLTTGVPRLLAAQSDGRVANFSDLFEPTQTNRLDADGTAHEFDIETRDFATGNGQPNHLRKLRMRYTLDGNATVHAGFSVGDQAQRYADVTGTYAQVKAAYANYDALFRGPGWQATALPPSPDDRARFWTPAGDIGLPAPGLNPAVWHLKAARRVRFVRMRFRTTDAPNRLIVHRLDLAVRPSTHDR